MDSGIPARRLSDRGFTSIQFLIASALALVFFLALANVVVVQYARGAMRSALDQGARSGSLTGSDLLCEERIGQVLDEILSGEIGDTVEYTCTVSAGLVTARGSLRVDSWTPLTGDYAVDLIAEASSENQLP